MLCAGNNAYFNATLKRKQKQFDIKNLCRVNGTILTSQADIEDEVLGFYGHLMGSVSASINGIDIVAIRNGMVMVEGFWLLWP